MMTLTKEQQNLFDIARICLLYDEYQDKGQVACRVCGEAIKPQGQQANAEAHTQVVVAAESHLLKHLLRDEVDGDIVAKAREGIYPYASATQTGPSNLEVAAGQMALAGRRSLPVLRSMGLGLIAAMGKMRGMKPIQIKNAIAGMVMLGAGFMLFLKGGVHPLALALVVGLGGMFMISALGYGKKKRAAKRRHKTTANTKGKAKPTRRSKAANKAKKGGRKGK